MKLTLLISFLLLSVLLSAQDNTPVSFTLGDRDRLMRNEQNIKSLRIEMNARFKAVDTRFEAIDIRFDSLQKQIDYNTTLLFLLLASVMSLIGFVIYDRRTAIKPIQREQVEQAEEILKLKRENNLFRESLKKAGML